MQANNDGQMTIEEVEQTIRDVESDSIRWHKSHYLKLLKFMLFKYHQEKETVDTLLRALSEERK